MVEPITEYPYFFTATNLEWEKLLDPDKYKDVIIESMKSKTKLNLDDCYPAVKEIQFIQSSSKLYPLQVG